MDEKMARVQDFVSRRLWAVVGVSEDPNKYGHLVFATMLNSGYHVYGVNPKNGQVLGHTIYRTLADLPEKPAVVSVVVPPAVTEQIVRQCLDLSITRVWMQPGAESQEAIDFCEANGIDVVWDACAMVQRKRSWD